MSLIARIKQLGRAECQIISFADRATHETIIATTRMSGTEPAPANVVLAISDPIQLLSALVVFDGRVDSLALVSSGTNGEEIRRRFAALGSYVLVSDDPALTTAITLSDAIARYHEREVIDTRWLLSTSGTTSSPKIVSHTLETLTRTVRNNGGSEFVWGQLYDPCRFAGLQVVMQALLGGSDIIIPNADATLVKRIEFLVQEGVNALSATPTLWRKMLMTHESRSLDLQSITLGGEIVDAGILSALATRYPNAKIRHIYASTEAGTGFSVTDGLPGFPYSYIPRAPNGVELRIDNEQLSIRNADVGRSYVGEEKDFADEEGFVRTGDQVLIKGGRVTFLGRESGVINVGGSKVYPERVESVLLDVSGVAQSRVRSIENSIVGQLVCADVVISAGFTEKQVEAQLYSIAAERLCKHERPFRYNFVDFIECTENGKVSRK